MAHEMKFPIRVVLYKEDELWVAHCLELDLLGSGRTRSVALKDLSVCIGLQLQESLNHDCPDNFFHPADGETWRRWAVGSKVKRDIATGILKVRLNGVSIPKVDTREYDATPRLSVNEMAFA